MKKAKNLLVVLSLLLSNYFAIGQQPGTLDPSFGTNGKVTTDFGTASTSDNMEDLLLQPDGKLIGVGWFHTGLASNYSDLALARYKVNGELDSTFGINGLVIKNLSTNGWNTDFVRCAALQSDGKILCTGGFDGSANIETFVARFLPNGDFDLTFGVNGIVSYNSVPGNPDQGYGLAVQQDGKIIIGVRESGDVIRLNSDGTFDMSYGISGIANVGQAIEKIAIQPDGKILAAGEYNPQGPWWWYFGVVRLDTAGNIDNSFGVNGRCFFDHTNILGSGYWSTWVNAIQVQPDGKIIVGGGTESMSGFPDTTYFAIGRINSNGTLDNSFGTDGRVVVDFPGDFERIHDITLQPDGKIFFLGEADNSDMAIVRLDSLGALDLTFNNTGKLQLDFLGSWDYGYASVLQPDGKLVIAGPVINGSDYDFGLARIFTGLNLGIFDNTPSENNGSIYPNPLTQNATIEYKLEKAEVITLRLYDTQGKLLQNILQSVPRQPGINKEQLNFGNELSAGNYFVKISMASGGNSTVKILKWN